MCEAFPIMDPEWVSSRACMMLITDNYGCAVGKKKSSQAIQTINVNVTIMRICSSRWNGQLRYASVDLYNLLLQHLGASARQLLCCHEWFIFSTSSVSLYSYFSLPAVFVSLCLRYGWVSVKMNFFTSLKHKTSKKKKHIPYIFRFNF